MIIGRRWWIVIWYGLLTLGVVGLIGAIHWGIKTRWRNLDEVLRGIGTICVSVGMLLLLHGTGRNIAETLLLAALIAFVLAFAVGRERRPPESPAASPADAPPVDHLDHHEPS